MKDNEIKALIPIACPHCEKPIVLELITLAPHLSAILTPQMIEDAKQEAIKAIEEMGLPEEKVVPVLSWIKNPDTVFSPSDIVDILNNLNDSNHESKETV